MMEWERRHELLYLPLLLFGFDVPFERLRQHAITVLLGVGFGLLLSFIPLAAPPGFTPLAGLYSFFLARMSRTSFLQFEVVKRQLMRRSFAVP